MALTFTAVQKHFGKHPAVQNVSLTIPTGTVHGLIGPNGAGKTTMMRLILRLLLPDSGTITWQGEPLRPDTCATFAYVPEERGLYPRETVQAHLQFFGQLWGLTPRQARSAADALMERLALTPYAHTRARDLSKGNARKTQVALGLLGQPALMVLDEPFDGMDPENSQRVQTVLQEVARQGTTVIVSSHGLSFLDGWIEGVTLLRQGAVAAHGVLADLRAALPWRTLRVNWRTWDAARLAAWEAQWPLERVSAPPQSLYRLDQSVADQLDIAALWTIGTLSAFAVEPPTLFDLYQHVMSHPAEEPLCTTVPC
ncbi:MAG: ABC transporter [Sulfobacillus benefaciens]|uniref:ABC transporter n=1 Tax=Sulfobacillus benefaciens TaxID=453960 RepID=A0A2T2XA52_9FIRM|nr:MAG: ABC transporter [Sulfobacillus benefaciens]